MKFVAHTLGACLAFLPVLGFAQATVFSTTFDAAHNALNSSTFNITSQGSTWNVASSRDATGSSLNAGGLTLTIQTSNSGFVEAQTRFTTSPITLSANGDYVKVVTTFSGTNVLNGSSTGLAIGLFDSGGSNPYTGLSNSGINATATLGSSYNTGGAASWDGYSAMLVGAGNSRLWERPPQRNTGETSRVQDLLFTSITPGYNSSNGGGVGTADAVSLTTSSTYTLAFTITLSAPTTYTVSYEVFSGSGTGGTSVASYSAATTPSTYLSNLTFDGLAIGARFRSGVAGDITYSSLSVITGGATAVPEPSTYAALAGLAALGLVAWRRRVARA